MLLLPILNTTDNPVLDLDLDENVENPNCPVGRRERLMAVPVGICWAGWHLCYRDG